MISGSVLLSAGKQFSTFPWQMVLLHRFAHIYSILWRYSKIAYGWWLLGHVESDIFHDRLRDLFQGQSVNIGKYSLLVLCAGSIELVTGLKYLMLVGFNKFDW